MLAALARALDFCSGQKQRSDYNVAGVQCKVNTADNGCKLNTAGRTMGGGGNNGGSDREVIGTGEEGQQVRRSELVENCEQMYY